MTRSRSTFPSSQRRGGRDAKKKGPFETERPRGAFSPKRFGVIDPPALRCLTQRSFAQAPLLWGEGNVLSSCPWASKS